MSAMASRTVCACAEGDRAHPPLRASGPPQSAYGRPTNTSLPREEKAARRAHRWCCQLAAAPCRLAGRSSGPSCPAATSPPEMAAFSSVGGERGDARRCDLEGAGCCDTHGGVVVRRAACPAADAAAAGRARLEQHDVSYPEPVPQVIYVYKALLTRDSHHVPQGRRELRVRGEPPFGGREHQGARHSKWASAPSGPPHPARKHTHTSLPGARPPSRMRNLWLQFIALHLQRVSSWRMPRSSE